MAYLYGGVTWRGDTGSPKAHELRVPIIKVASAALLSAFRLSLRPHSKCNLAYYHYFVDYPYQLTSPGVGANVDKIALIYFRDPDSLMPESFAYPDPIAADLEDVGYGIRVKQSAVIAVVGYLSTLAGVSYIPLYGVYYQVD
ncbi:MAG: hypothetical protein V3V31_03785 [Methylococcales bacterium]